MSIFFNLLGKKKSNILPLLFVLLICFRTCYASNCVRILLFECDDVEKAISATSVVNDIERNLPYWMNENKHKLHGKPIKDFFDIIIGHSFGGIVAIKTCLETDDKPSIPDDCWSPLIKSYKECEEECRGRSNVSWVERVLGVGGIVGAGTLAYASYTMVGTGLKKSCFYGPAAILGAVSLSCLVWSPVSSLVRGYKIRKNNNEKKQIINKISNGLGDLGEQQLEHLGYSPAIFIPIKYPDGSEDSELLYSVEGASSTNLSLSEIIQCSCFQPCMDKDKLKLLFSSNTKDEGVKKLEACIENCLDRSPKNKSKEATTENVYILNVTSYSGDSPLNLALTTLLKKCLKLPAERIDTAKVWLHQSNSEECLHNVERMMTILAPKYLAKEKGENGANNSSDESSD